MPTTHKIALRCGREIWIVELNQELTYAGLLEGFPTTQDNKRKLDGLLAECRANARETPVQLLNPREKLIDIETRNPYPFGTPAALPSVTCVAKFRSEALGGHDALAYSELILIWFQEEFAMPIEELVLNEISELDWVTAAREFEK